MIVVYDSFSCPYPGVLHRLLILLLTFHFSDGLAVFRYFLKLEFSEENLDFWLAVERFKRTRPLSKMVSRAANIYDEFVAVNASRQVLVCLAVRPLFGLMIIGHVTLLLPASRS